MGLHKLTAGDGYTYLTRQVAASDTTERGYASLADYYAAKGESPGRWWGSGLGSLGVTGDVTEAQMRALFGQGTHPDTDKITTDLTAEGATAADIAAATRLGSPYKIYEGSTAWRDGLAERYQAWNQVRDRPANAPVPPDERARLRTELARDMFTERHGRPPLHPGELSGFLAQQSRPQSTAVAGFDLTFSPVKSVSTLWAIADPQTAQRIEAAHDAAVTATLEFLQTHATYTRLGTNGVRQVDTRGLIAARFTHRDSRAGDPDLHTHVAVSNKVQTHDGRWLALDGRMLYRYKVTASEFYNTRLEAEITQRVGGTFTDRATAPGKRPVRELVGVDPALLARWSSRRRAIEGITAELAAAFVRDHGRIPTAVETLRLAQQATLQTRDAKKEPQSLGEQRQRWRRQAIEILGHDAALDRMITAATTRTADPSHAITPGLIDELAADDDRACRRDPRPLVRNQRPRRSPPPSSRRRHRPRPAHRLRRRRHPPRSRRRPLRPHRRRPRRHPRPARARRTPPLRRHLRVSRRQRPAIHLTRHPGRRTAPGPRRRTRRRNARRPRRGADRDARMVGQPRRSATEPRASRDGHRDRHQRPARPARPGPSRHRENHRHGCSRRRLAQRRR